MSKTIKQLADEFGVSKTAIRKRFTDEFRLKYVQTTSDGSFQVSDEGCKLIAESFRKQAETIPETKQIAETKFAKTGENPGLQQSLDIQKETIEFLKAQLIVKDEQLRAQQQQLSTKDEQIKQLTTAMENTTAALTAAQALHAGTMQEHLTLTQDQNEETNVVTEKEETQKRGLFKRLFGKKNIDN